jgi:hypothetical protein
LGAIDRNDLAVVAGLLLVGVGAYAAAGVGGLFVVVGLVLVALGTYGASRAGKAP